MSEHDIVTVGRALPKLATVEPANGSFSVSVTWASGSRVGRTDVVDLAPMIFTFKVYRPLRDGAVRFASVRLGEWGASLVWEGNDDLDIGAESIEEMADEVMTNADFAEFLKRNNLTLDAAAAQLGIARRLVAYYAKEREIPRAVALACRYLDLTLGETPTGPSVSDWMNVANGCVVTHVGKPAGMVIPPIVSVGTDVWPTGMGYALAPVVNIPRVDPDQALQRLKDEGIVGRGARGWPKGNAPPAGSFRFFDLNKKEV